MISTMRNLIWISCLLSVSVVNLSSAEKPVDTTISDLSLHPRQFDGQVVRIKAVLIFGWEGDNFLLDPSKPKPLAMPSLDPASIWIYWKPGHEKQAYQITGVVYGTFEGYFHFVHETRIVNGVFEPGPLQFEATEASIPDPQPRSLAAATARGDVDETRRLLGSDRETRDRYASSLLFLSAQVGRVDFALELLASGADPNFFDADGDTSLMTAAWNCTPEVANALLSHGALANATNAHGETALKLAAHNCPDGKLVQLLLSAGADPNAKTRNGVTALISASGNSINAEELLKAGADPSIRTESGTTVESESCGRGEKGHYEVCQLVRAALRKKNGLPDK